MTSSNSIREFVQNLYRSILLREGESDGIAYWSELAETGLSSIDMTRDFIASSEARSIMAVLRLYDVFFDRAADVEGLRHWVQSLQAGLSFNDIARGFSQSEEYKQRYQYESSSGIIEAFYNNLFERSGDAGGKASWLDMTERGGWSLAQVTAAFAVSDESMKADGVATRFIETYLALRASDGKAPTTQAVDALARHDLTEAITALQTVRGTVQAGTLANVNVYRSADSSGLQGSETTSVTTDASGYFALAGGYGNFYATGGKDLTTGAANTKLLSTLAPAQGAAIIVTPLTTVIHALVNRGYAITDAVFLVNQAFGIDTGTDLLSFHYLDKAIASGTSTGGKKNALVVKQVISEISILMEGVAALIKGAAKDPELDTGIISIRVAEALAEKIAGAAAQDKPFQAGTLLGLESADMIAELMASSLAGANTTGTSSLRIAAEAQPGGLVMDAARIVATFNTPISKTIQLINGLSAIDSSTMLDALSVIARTEGLAMREIHALIAIGAQDGKLSEEATSLLSRNLGEAIRSFVIGRLAEGIESTQAYAIINRIFNIAPSHDNGNASEPAAPDFFMTQFPDRISFSGSATGDITLAIDMNGAISFWRAGVMASVKGSALSGLVIEPPAGQAIRMSSAQLAQIADFTIKGSGNLVIDGALSIAARNGIQFDSFTGGFSHRIQDTPDNVLNAAPASLNGAQQVTVVAGSNVVYSASDAAKLVARLTDRAGLTLGVADTAAALLGNHSIAGVSGYKLSENAGDLSVANAVALVGISGFDRNSKLITVQDSAAAILANHAITGVSGYKLSENANDLSIANAVALVGTTSFSAAGKSITVKDSFDAIRAKHDIAGVTKYQLDANTTVANVMTLHSEGLDPPKLRYVIADAASAAIAASTDLLNGADSLFSSASPGNDNIDLNRSGAITLQINIDLGSGNDTFLGGTGEDYVNGNLGVDVINGGPGRDFYIYSDKGTDSQVNSGNATAAGFDLVDITGGDAFYIAPFSAVRTVLNAVDPTGGSGTDLLAALNDAYAPVAVASTNIMFVRFLDGNQYLVINDGQDSNTAISAADTVIKIIGSGLPEAATSNLLLFK